MCEDGCCDVLTGEAAAGGAVGSKDVSCASGGCGAAVWLRAAENHDEDEVGWKTGVVSSAGPPAVVVPFPSWLVNQAMGASGGSS